jgi:RNA polymerase sigma-70 factor (ECF subfamily)
MTPSDSPTSGPIRTARERPAKRETAATCQPAGASGRTLLSTDAIWKTFSAGLARFVRRRVASREDADDVLQDIFLRVHQNLPRLRDSERLAGWLYRIARNAVVDYRRRRRRMTVPVDEVSLAADEPEDGVTAEVACWLTGFLAELPETYRAALRLAEYEDLSHVEIARRLGLSVSGAKSRVRRGRALLRRRLLACCHVELDRRGNVLDYRSRQTDCCSSCA